MRPMRPMRYFVKPHRVGTLCTATFLTHTRRPKTIHTDFFDFISLSAHSQRTTVYNISSVTLSDVAGAACLHIVTSPSSPNQKISYKTIA